MLPVEGPSIPCVQRAYIGCKREGSLKVEKGTHRPSFNYNFFFKALMTRKLRFHD